MGALPAGRPRVSVLLSGGLDSAACLAFYLKQGFEAEALFFDYGQISAAREQAAARAVCVHYGVDLQSVVCTGLRPPVLVEVKGRNALLLMGALVQANANVGIIGIGLHAGTPYSDCTPGFIDDCQRLFDRYMSGRIRIGAPFISWTKQEIWQFIREANVPSALTYSCELGREQPCGECPSCQDLRALYAC